MDLVEIEFQWKQVEMYIALGKSAAQIDLPSLKFPNQLDRPPHPNRE